MANLIVICGPQAVEKMTVAESVLCLILKGRFHMAPKKIKIKPGKMQSKIGLIAGVLFVILGCVVVIPTFGLFGVVWTAAAGLITFTNFRNAFTDKGVSTHEIIIEDGGEVATTCEDVEKELEIRLIGFTLWKRTVFYFLMKNI